jgi:nicotinamidase-related amidase
MVKALLIIDMLVDFLDKDGALCIGDSKHITKNVLSRVREWRTNRHPVIYIVDCFPS